MSITPESTFLVPVGGSRISRDGFAAVLERYAAPGVLSERPGGAYYDAIVRTQTPEGTHVDPLLILAKFNHESSMGRAGVAVTTHSWGNTRKPTFGAVPIGDADGMSGSFPIFRDWLDGCVSTAARLVAPNYVYYGWGRRTIREIYDWQDDPDTEEDESEIVWAPAGDYNNPDSYLRAVIDFMNDHTDQEGGAVAGKVPKPAMRTDVRSPNYYSSGRKIEAIVLHISDGSQAGDLSWLTNPNSEASSNYYITKDGTIYELVPPHLGPFTNGPKRNPNLNIPLVAAWVRDGINPNTRTLTIEHEGKPADALTPEQLLSTIALQAWLTDEYALPVDRDHILSHADIDSVERWYCPSFSDAEWNSIIGGITTLRAKYAGVEPSPPADPNVFVSEHVDYGTFYIINQMTDDGWVAMKDAWESFGGVNGMGLPLGGMVRQVAPDGAPVYRQPYERGIVEVYPTQRRFARGGIVQNWQWYRPIAAKIAKVWRDREKAA